MIVSTIFLDCISLMCYMYSLGKNKQTFHFLPVKPVATSVKSLRLTREDFEIVKVIGRGAFGEVCVVKMKGSDKVKDDAMFFKK